MYVVFLFYKFNNMNYTMEVVLVLVLVLLLQQFFASEILFMFSHWIYQQH